MARCATMAIPSTASATASPSGGSPLAAPLSSAHHHTITQDTASAHSMCPHRYEHKRRPRPTWLVILFLAALLATVFVLAATLTTIHTPSLKNPARFMAPSGNAPVHVPVAQSTEQIESKQDALPQLHPPPDFPHLCYIQPPVNWSESEDHNYPFNARSICLTSSICFQPATPDRPSIFYASASLSETTCRNVTTVFDVLSDAPFNCSRVQQRVHCGHGRFVPPRTPECPETRAMSSLSSDQLGAARWIDGIVFFVPAYPHMGNIFHFSFVAGAINHLVAYIPKVVRQWGGNDIQLPDPIPVTVMLRGGSLPSFGGWQTGILNLIINNRLKPEGLRVSLATMNESVIGDPERKLRSKQLTCAKSAVLLGTRSHINLWPFPGHSWPDLSGNSVPLESIVFRHAAYEAVGIQSILPHVTNVALEGPPLQAMSELPPRVIGYSCRNFYPDPSKEQPYQQGTVRRFSDADEQWFVNMLKTVARTYNFSYVKLTTDNEMPFAEQVKLYAGVGVAAGIHGANLMNTMFMRPFAGLVEVFASGTPLQCYISGANSGLAYVGYDPIRKASGEESGCHPSHPTCWVLSHARRVMIDSDEDRKALRTHVEEAVQRIIRLHNEFGHLGGIPMEHVRWKNEYRVAWEHAKTKPSGRQ